ncbi:hypothetical protein [Microbacterium halotolerans]|uniref:hypothetical protein n=1 Tax=Microbacterium halotolerans TaxID=246613 RepID=UPI000E6AC3A3|nr:hypothetical protein [Microbacterium halotolerans]
MDAGRDEAEQERRAPESPLTGAYGAIRAIEASEGPVRGVLARGPDGPVALTDADRLDGWAGWAMRGQHVYAPIDVVRRPDGHDVVLPWCPHRVAEDWAARRLTGGQAVTLAVSLLRGATEARQGERGASQGPVGRWWADVDGRPVFVASLPGDGEPARGAAEGAAAVLRTVAEKAADRVVIRLLDRAVAALHDPARLEGDLRELEADLFDACAPQPLSFEAGTDGDAAASPTAGDVRSANREWSVDPRALAESVWNGRIAEAAADVLAQVKGAASRALRGRRAAYLAGAAAALAVVLVGVLLPQGEPPAAADGGAVRSDSGVHGDEMDAQEQAEDGHDAAAPRDGQRSGDDAEREESGNETDEAVPGSEDGNGEEIAVQVQAMPVDAATSLLRRAASCAESGDATCDGTIEPGSNLTADGAPWHELAEAQISLVDDYGGAALVRAESDADAHYLSLALRDGLWMLRDVYAAG